MTDGDTSRDDTQHSVGHERHPSEFCSFCGVDLGIEEGYVYPAGKRIIITCESLRCRASAQRAAEVMDRE